MMKKILIPGCGCSGKSTLAVQLGGILNLPVYHLDRYFWSSGWVERPREEWLADLNELLSLDEWIIDGNYGSTLPVRIPVSDTIIWIDLPRWRIMLRMIKRVVTTYGRTRSDMAPGCREHFDREFIEWLWNWPKKSRVWLVDMLHLHGDGKTIHHLKSPHEVKRFIAALTDSKFGVL